ncbi:hypothetical protein PAHA111176_09145 [Parendozoicomonas haliclonae]|uniref:Uncharacterized protein n=2 Tax=Parendozoicomonas haliclonae TaxID=1960125 RepID=A0A1X7ANU3_9GAMM|nr:hypothetical protein EHSB41UT_03765 [Parendozoicomonas haliclonae]
MLQAVLVCLLLILQQPAFSASAGGSVFAKADKQTQKKRNKLHQKHMMLKEQVEHQLEAHYDRNLLKPDKHAFRKLALYHPVTGVIAPLFGSKPSRKLHGHTVESHALPLNATLWKAARAEIQDLESNWLLVITDSNDLPLHVLGTSQDELEELPGYQSERGNRSEYLNLDQFKVENNREVYGLTDITQPDSPILTIASHSPSSSKQTQFRANIIEAFQQLPADLSDRLALVTATPYNHALRISRLLTSIHNLSTKPEVLTPAGDIVFSAAYPIKQLTPQEKLPTPSGNQQQFTPLPQDNQYRIDLVLAMEDDDGHAFYHRISSLPHPDNWQAESSEEANQSEQFQVEIPAEQLLKLSGSSHLRHQKLFLKEHDPEHNRDALYPLSGRSINSLLLALDEIKGQKKLQALQTTPNAKGLKGLITLQLPGKKPELDPALLPEQEQQTSSEAVVEEATPTSSGKSAYDPDAPGSLGAKNSEKPAAVMSTPAAETNQNKVEHKLLEPARLANRNGQPVSKVAITAPSKPNLPSISSKKQRAQNKDVKNVFRAVQKWQKDIVKSQPNLKVSSEKTTSSQLALLHMPTGAWVYLVDEQDHALAITPELIGSLHQAVSLSAEWFLTVSQPVGSHPEQTLTRLLPPTLPQLEKCKAFDKKKQQFNLDWNWLPIGHEILALADVSQNNKLVFTLPFHYDKQGFVRVEAELIKALQQLPADLQDRLALVTASRPVHPTYIDRPEESDAPSVSRLLMPLKALRADKNYMVDQENLAISTSFPAKQLKVGSLNPNRQEDLRITKTYQHMSTPADGVRHQNVVLSARGEDGTTIYHRLGSLPSYESWGRPNSLLPDKALPLPVQPLLALLSMPAFQDSQLLIEDVSTILSNNIEHFPLSQPLHEILPQGFQSRKAFKNALASSATVLQQKELEDQYLLCQLPDIRYAKTRRKAPAKNDDEEKAQKLARLQADIAKTRAAKQQGFLLDISQAEKIHHPQANTPVADNRPVRKSRQMTVDDLAGAQKDNQNVDNANNLVQIDAEKAQKDKDRILVQNSVPPVRNPLIPTGRGMNNNKGVPSQPDEDGNDNNKPTAKPDKPQPKLKWSDGKDETPMKIRPSGAPKKNDIMNMRGEQAQLSERLKERQLRERQAFEKRQAGQTDETEALEMEIQDPFAESAETVQQQLAPHIEQPPIERMGRWLGNYIVTNPVHSAAAIVTAIAAFNLIRQWWQLPDARDLLIKDTVHLMGPSAPPFWHEALEVLVYGTPDDLLDLWTADRLYAWVSQAATAWCSRNTCNARYLSDIFVHYVLSPVSSDRDSFIKELQLRISSANVNKKDPRQWAVALRRAGIPAVVDFNPTTQQEWMTELNDNGLIKAVHANINERHLPVKVFRRSFLKTGLTHPQHERYKEIINQGLITDVTNQYRPHVAPYPSENYRFGVYTCTTVDGDTWYVVDITDEEPGMHALPGLVAYAHEAKNGICVVPSMDIWLSTLQENGQILTLNPDGAHTLSVNIDLADTMRGVDPASLNNETCRLQYWKNRSWKTVSTQEHEPGIMQAALPQFALYRLRCHKETTLFTINTLKSELTLWSWPVDKTAPDG